MHPYISQSLMEARLADLHQAAASTRRARQARQARHAARHAARWVRPQGVAPQPVAQPAREELPAAQPAREELPVAHRVLTH